MKQIGIIIFSVLLLCLISSCSNKEEQNHEEMQVEAAEVKSEIVREGVIDVESLDQNKDGNIYECPMDWNVLDDRDGNCPVCGMKLKEFPISGVKDNLTKYGYEYKN